MNAAAASTAAPTSPQTPSAIATTLFQVGATASYDPIPPKRVSPPATPSTAAPASSAASPAFWNHLRFFISEPTADLNEVKRSELPVRSSSIRSRNFERRSGPSARIESITWATGASKASTGASTSPSESSRSATCCVFSPPQIFLSVVTWSAR